MSTIDDQSVVEAGKLAEEIFAKYNITQEDQDKLYNALSTIGLWRISQK
jgi:acetyl-CoA acetyltransferase